MISTGSVADDATSVLMAGGQAKNQQIDRKPSGRAGLPAIFARLVELVDAAETLAGAQIKPDHWASSGSAISCGNCHRAGDVMRFRHKPECPVGRVLRLVEDLRGKPTMAQAEKQLISDIAQALQIPPSFFVPVVDDWKRANPNFVAVVPGVDVSVPEDDLAAPMPDEMPERRVVCGARPEHGTRRSICGKAVGHPDGWHSDVDTGETWAVFNGREIAETAR
jgi:hypothetical protein